MCDKKIKWNARDYKGKKREQNRTLHCHSGGPYFKYTLNMCVVFVTSSQK